MDTGTSAERSRLAAALACVPDEARWVDTRGMMLSGRAHLVPGTTADVRDGFVVIVPDVSLASVIGEPPADAIRQAVAQLAGDVNVLADSANAAHVSASLAGWRRSTAVLHILPEPMAWEREEDPGVRIFTRENAPSLEHVPEDLAHELRDALRGRTTARFVPGTLPQDVQVAMRSTIPMAAVWADRRPVAFCYPVWQTDRWWDVSIDTLAPYRRRGFGARAARALIRYMRRSSQSPVWGALESNHASRTLAARLGFIEIAGVAVFTKR